MIKRCQAHQVLRAYKLAKIKILAKGNHDHLKRARFLTNHLHHLELIQ